MSPEQAAAAWRRDLIRVTQAAPPELVHWFADLLASDVTADVLARLAGDLTIITDVLAEEAASRVAEPTVAVVIPLRRASPRPNDFPPAAA